MSTAKQNRSLKNNIFVNYMKRLKIGLLGKIIIAIAAGIGAGAICPEWIVRIFVTFNSIFGQFLSFAIPLIIVGLVTPAIADIGNKAGKMLLVTVAIAYVSTVAAGLISYLTGNALFHSIYDLSVIYLSFNSTELLQLIDIREYLR